MTKHDKDHHQGMKHSYTAKFLGEERGLLPLAMREALLIERQMSGKSMNDKLKHE